MKTIFFSHGLTGATVSLLLGALLLYPTAARAQTSIPIGGKPVPALEDFDTLMTVIMETNNVSAGVLGVMKDGCIVYQRSFGWEDEARQIPLQETAMMRLASVTKPLTAAAIRQLEKEGLVDVDVDRAFNLGQAVQFPTNQILDCFSPPEAGGFLPFPDTGEPGDTNHVIITVDHLIQHRAGWDRGRVTEYTNIEGTIAGDMGVDMPPGRTNTMRYILGQPLQYNPGVTVQCAFNNDVCQGGNSRTCYCARYSNVAYLTLGFIVESLSGEGYLSYLKHAVFSPLPWCPTTFLQQGHTLFADAHPLEPWYDSEGDFADHSVYPPYQRVPQAYGGWDHEARLFNGGLISDTRTLLKYLDTYNVGLYDPDIGKELGGIRVTKSHGGDKLGTMALAYQRSDGFNFMAIFNRHQPDSGTNLSMRATLAQGLAAVATDPGVDWPETGVDGQWVRFDTSATEHSGSYDQPYANLTTALDHAPHEETLNLTGESDWTGAIDQVVRLRAHYGTVVIGQP